MPFAIRVVQEFIHPTDDVAAAEEYMRALAKREVNEAVLIRDGACMARLTAEEAEARRPAPPAVTHTGPQ